MTTTRITQSGQTGIKPTDDYDVEMYTAYRSTRTTIRGLTEKGRDWIFKNMVQAGARMGHAVIHEEAREEIRQLMYEAKLKVRVI